MNDIHAKRSLGQHWLVNEGIADRIVAAAQPEPSDTILEIGPGKGILTARLAKHVGRLIAIEKDRQLIEPLREQFANTPNIAIYEGDVLELDPQALELSPGEYKVVANLPYYITARFLRLMLSAWPTPTLAVLMVQREVFQRLQAEEGNMNLLALSVQAYAETEKIVDVSRGSFRPMPDVDSAVIVLRPRALVDEQRALVEKVIGIAKSAFGQKRKQLTATIEPGMLSRCGIEPSRRPQELSFSDWECIARANV